MQKRLGEDYPAFLSSYDAPSAKGLRVNTLKISPAGFARRAPFPLGEQVGGDPACFYIEEERPGADPYHFAGLYYLQEPSAMTVGDLLENCGPRVLDLCAAPGGKTTHIAQKMGGEGILIANEVNYARAKILSENVERMGIKNCAVVSADPETLARKFPAYFDLVLADAPCSGEGMFKKEPNAIPEWSEENVSMCAARQRRILDCAAETVCAGGRLVYSTCTFSEEEDEWQVEGFLARHPDFSIIEQHKLYPHTFRGEGHFMALLGRRPDAAPAEGRCKPFRIRRDGEAERAFSAFCADVLGPVPDGAVHTLADGRMYLIPRDMPDLTGFDLVRVGVELGAWDGRLFKPAHGLAMAFGGAAKKKISLSREEAKGYLRGETFEWDTENGWYVVCVDGYPLGLGKAVNGVVKNHYPKSARLRS